VVVLELVGLLGWTRGLLRHAATLPAYL